MRLTPLVFLLLPAVSDARTVVRELPPAPTLQITAEARASSLVLVFTNPTSQPIKIPVRMNAHVVNYDWLTVTLERDTWQRTLQFVTDRDRAAPHLVELAPQATHRETIDLVPWAIRSGAPIAPGDYHVGIVWDTTREKASRGRLTASVRLSIAAPIEKRCTGAATGKLELVARQLPKSPTIEVGLHNAGDTTICVHSAIRAGSLQSDWLTASITDARNAPPRVLGFSDDRDESGLVTVELAPGATSWTLWNLEQWSKRKRNGGAAFARGPAHAKLTYDAKSVRGAWAGTVATELALTLP